MRIVATYWVLNGTDGCSWIIRESTYLSKPAANSLRLRFLPPTQLSCCYSISKYILLNANTIKKPNILPQTQQHTAAYNFVTGYIAVYIRLCWICIELVQKFGARLKFTWIVFAHWTRSEWGFPARVYWLIVGARATSGGSVVEGTLGVARTPVRAHWL